MIASRKFPGPQPWIDVYNYTHKPRIVKYKRSPPGDNFSVIGTKTAFHPQTRKTAGPKGTCRFLLPYHALEFLA